MGLTLNLSPACGSGQVTYTLSGRLTDASGNPRPNERILVGEPLSNDITGISTIHCNIFTDSNGNYSCTTTIPNNPAAVEFIAKSASFSPIEVSLPVLTCPPSQIERLDSAQVNGTNFLSGASIIVARNTILNIEVVIGNTINYPRNVMIKLLDNGGAVRDTQTEMISGTITKALSTSYQGSETSFRVELHDVIHGLQQSVSFNIVQPPTSVITVPTEPFISPPVAIAPPPTLHIQPYPYPIPPTFIATPSYQFPFQFPFFPLPQSFYNLPQTPINPADIFAPPTAPALQEGPAGAPAPPPTSPLKPPHPNIPLSTPVFGLVDTNIEVEPLVNLILRFFGGLKLSI